ncbi:NAD(P)/FAD-dependent oxidoreductase [Mumia zhuanghuii]|uniref:NAD(P)/FAD-dependent oxidoreductase n=1 Tax=Mumia zhuanghuii TaxID=2585211 RepID=UPI00362AB440
MSAPGVRAGDPDASYDVVVIGAGIQGLSTAYELAKRGVKRIAVLDRAWPGGGASGRNGELIRSIFSSPEWVGLFDLSLTRWHQLSAELEMNVLFSSSGYLVLASTDEQWANCERDHAYHRSEGVDSDLLSQADVLALVPALNPDVVRGGVVQPSGGFAHHDAVNWAYLKAGARRGVEVYCDLTVTGLTTAAGRVTGVQTSRGPIAAGLVLNAAGGNALDVNAWAGITLPMVTSRLEMLVTEPLAPFLRQGLAALALLGYCHQTARGEFVGGTERHHVDESRSQNSTWDLLADMATKWVTLFPLLSGARLLRNWAGTVTQAADLAPVIGSVPDVEGYVMTCGWVYGFMGAPGASTLLAEEIVTGTPSPVLAPFSPRRLTEGRMIAESSLVVPTGEDHA